MSRIRHLHRRLAAHHPAAPLAFALAVPVVAAVALVGLAPMGDATPSRTPLPTGPATLPTGIEPLNPAAAQAANQARPDAALAVSPAPPFTATMTRQDRIRATECLASALYYEAALEGDDGQRAVAQVVLNRVRHPAFPANVCGVVYEGSTRPTGCQFTFTCDNSMSRAPVRALYDRARRLAAEALAGSVYAPVGTATHYHADYVVPRWAGEMAKIETVGRHLFYRWPGSWGQPGALTSAYRGREGAPELLRRAALAAPHVLAAVPAEASAAPLAVPPPGVATVQFGKDRKVIARFRPEARAASEAAPHRDYVERVAASDNLRYALGDDGADGASRQAPLGRLDSNPDAVHKPGS